MKPRNQDFIRAFLRSFSVQGSWNYRTMIGTGMGYAMSPLLERICAGDPVSLRAALERHTREFNAHPYLSPLAIGALARLEHDGDDPETLDRFRTALRAPLGALGDQSVWAGWRPFCTLAASIAFLLGVGPVVAAALFLLIYNVGHIGLRFWGFKVGWRAGRGVGTALREARLGRWAGWTVVANQALMGALAALLIAKVGANGAPAWATAGAAIAGMLGYLFPRLGSGPAIAGLFAAGLVWAF